MSTLDILALAAVLLIGVPTLTYLCVKLGAYAYVRGKDQAQNDITNERKANGNEHPPKAGTP